MIQLSLAWGRCVELPADWQSFSSAFLALNVGEENQLLFGDFGDVKQGAHAMLGILPLLYIYALISHSSRPLIYLDTLRFY
jgi:hypothetical protein